MAGGDFPLTASGSDVTGVPAALAIVGLAALVAVFAVRRSGRLLVAALLALSGAGTIAAAVLGASDSSALDEKAARATGDTAATVSTLSHTGWPYAAAVGGALILLAGLLALRYGRLWPAMSGRYERGGAPVRAPGRGPSTPTGPRRSGRPSTAARTRRGHSFTGDSLGRPPASPTRARAGQWTTSFRLTTFCIPQPATQQRGASHGGH